MLRTATLRAQPARSPLELHPLARLHLDGRLELLEPAFPPLGGLGLVLWRPGEDPPFSLVRGTLAAGWRWEGPPAEAFVVLWFVDPSQRI